MSGRWQSTESQECSQDAPHTPTALAPVGHFVKIHVESVSKNLHVSHGLACRSGVHFKCWQNTSSGYSQLEQF